MIQYRPRHFWFIRTDNSTFTLTPPPESTKTSHTYVHTPNRSWCSFSHEKHPYNLIFHCRIAFYARYIPVTLHRSTDYNIKIRTKTKLCSINKALIVDSAFPRSISLSRLVAYHLFEPFQYVAYSFALVSKFHCTCLFVIVSARLWRFRSLRLIRFSFVMLGVVLFSV